jgi:hypothetical protein
MSKNDLHSEPRASDLLPPDEPPERPEFKLIAERRVAGWSTTARLATRLERRPAGNSRRFWKTIEDDDPFLAAPAAKRLPQSSHELYPADRLQRIEPARTKPRPAAAAPKPKPRAAPSKPAPQPVHTPDARAIKPPASDAPEGQPAVDRRPPRLPNPNVKTRPRGRMSVGKSHRGQANPTHQRPASKTAEEIRATKQAEREAAGPAAPPSLRGIDSVLAMLGELRAAETLYKQGVTGNTDGDIADEPRPKPKAWAAKPKATSPSPSQKPTPPPPAPPKAKPTPPQAKPPLNRSPSASNAGGGMDDLFGGPSESRVRIGKRNKPKSTDSES